MSAEYLIFLASSTLLSFKCVPGSLTSPSQCPNGLFFFSRLLNADALAGPLLSLAGPVLAYSSNCFHMQMVTVCFKHIQILFLQLLSISVHLMAYNHLKFKYVCPKLDFSLSSPRGQPQTYSSFVHPSVSSIPASGMKPSCNSPSPKLAFTIPSQILLILLTRNGN